MCQHKSLQSIFSVLWWSKTDNWDFFNFSWSGETSFMDLLSTTSLRNAGQELWSRWNMNILGVKNERPTVHVVFKNLPRSPLVGEPVFPLLSTTLFPNWSVAISFKDDGTVILYLGVSRFLYVSPLFDSTHSFSYAKCYLRISGDWIVCR